MFRREKERTVEAYKKICGADDPYRTYAVLNRLERTGLSISGGETRSILPDGYKKEAESYLAQILLRSSRKAANPSIMRWFAGDKSPAILPYPRAWRDEVEKNGISISFLASSFSFFLAQCRAWVRAWRTYKDCLDNADARSSFPAAGEYIALSQIPAHVIPLANRRHQAHTFADWLRESGRIDTSLPVLIQTKADDRETLTGYHLVRHLLPGLQKDQKEKFRHVARRRAFSALLHWMRGKWSAPYLCAAGIELAYFEQVDNPASIYLFSNSEFAIRPFWTYLAERSGSRIILYFYSANINCFYKGQTEDSPPPPGYMAMSWPEYWVVDQDQMDFLRENCGVQGELSKVGSPDFSDTDDELPDIPEGAVALFDITPFDLNHVAEMALIAPYYTPEIVSAFLYDILSCVRETGGSIVWKQKRDIPASLLSDEYARIVDELDRDPHIIRIPAGISARRVMKKVAGCISVPFTSTAVLADEMSVPSVFYDPTQTITYTKKCAHGIPVLYGKDALREWLSSIGKRA